MLLLFKMAAALTECAREVASNATPVSWHGSNAHIVWTRFGHGAHDALNRARLEMFQTLCAPSMLAQESMFHWFVFVDDRVDRAVKIALQDTLRPASFAHFVEVDVTTCGDISDRNVGDIVDLVALSPPDFKDWRVIFTRVDATDALHHRSIGEIQSVLRDPRSNAGSGFRQLYRIVCWNGLLAWYPSADRLGALDVDRSDFPACFAPGLTFEVSSESWFDDIWRRTTPLNVSHDHILGRHRKNGWQSVDARAFDLPLRARTLASDGFSGTLDIGLVRTVTAASTVKGVVREYGVRPVPLARCNRRMLETAANVTQDRLACCIDDGSGCDLTSSRSTAPKHRHCPEHLKYHFELATKNYTQMLTALRSFSDERRR